MWGDFMKPITMLRQLQHNYDDRILQEIIYCRDEIRGLKSQWFGYDDEEIESNIGNYLDEVYDSYKAPLVERGLISDSEFDRIYSIVECIPGKIRL